MIKTVTFTWSTTIEVSDDFDTQDEQMIAEARRAAWMNVQESDGELTDEGEADY
jgi:hypothetical protein